ncbi:DNA-binding HxlR family transcriptional regulator [Methanococcus voltae]|uniref:MarR family transcriptional regulator n=1 Tax=Methanococcus voltae TaxID=2188 RepID=UPI001AE2975B|nr:MarR family transcriptional regulator [Methanococcus voltae]MBP2143927.1 DNA-binding HxlR family transcriptional regulator [Methanococcus voltae]
MLLKTLTKKYVKEILYILYNRGELYSGQIQNELDIDSGNLSKILSTLVKKKLVFKRREPKGESMPMSYFKLSDLGKSVIKIYEISEALERNKNIEIIIKDSNNAKKNIQSNNTINDNSGFVNTGNIGGNVKFQK